MKGLITTACFLFLFNWSFGQSSVGNNYPEQLSLWEKYNAKYDNPKYVLDNKALTDSSAKRVLDAVDPYDVTKVLIAHASSKNERNTVYITTATEKVMAYQKKLAAFSKDYQDYLQAKGNTERFFLYFINSTPVSGERRDVIDTLYNIPAAKITGVSFALQAPMNGGTQMAMVSITTAQ